MLEGGDGPPLVLLHGAGTYGAIWQQVIPDLKVTHRVIAPDLPGHGSSSLPDGPLDEGRVDAWLGGLVEQTCQSAPMLVGQLVGGAIAARFAANHPDQVDALVLVVPLGLAPFQPTPEFGAALTGFLAKPGEDTHDELWKHCVFDLDATHSRACWSPILQRTSARSSAMRSTECSASAREGRDQPP